MRVLRSQRVAVWAIGLLLLVLVGCGETLSDVPGELIGIWQTDRHGYEGRSLEIRQNLLRFGTGESEADSYTVIGSTQEEADNGIAYTIVYRDAQFDEARLHLVYHPSGKSLRLKNRPHIEWWRRGAAPLQNRASEPRAEGVGHVD